MACKAQWCFNLCTHTHTRTHTHACIRTYICTYVRVCSVFLDTYVRAYVYVYVCTYVRMYAPHYLWLGVPKRCDTALDWDSLVLLLLVVVLLLHMPWRSVCVCVCVQPLYWASCRGYSHIRTYVCVHVTYIPKFRVYIQSDTQVWACYICTYVCTYVCMW